MWVFSKSREIVVNTDNVKCFSIAKSFNMQSDARELMADEIALERFGTLEAAKKTLDEIIGLTVLKTQEIYTIE